MVGRAFLQCVLDEPTHNLLHERLGIPPEERNAMRDGLEDGPIKLYWLADIKYDAFGHLHFFGVEADLAALGGDAVLPAQLTRAFADALAEPFGAELAGRLPALGDWDCNTLQYAQPLEEDTVSRLEGKAEARETWPAIIEGGKHAGPAQTVALVRNGSGETTLVATCRRSKLNALLGLKGLGVRPLFKLLEPAVTQAVLRHAYKQHTDVRQTPETSGTVKP